MTRTRWSFALILLVTACAPSKPGSADYIGVWAGAKNGCECMLHVAAYENRFRISNENDCTACSAFEGFYSLTSDGNLVGGTTGVVTLTHGGSKGTATLRSGSALHNLKRLSARALARWRFARRLMSRQGFNVDDQPVDLCSIGGEAGRCQFAPFPMGDAGSRSCATFATARYAGDCIDGMLSGLCLIRGVQHVAEGDVALGYFASGRVLYPVYIANTRDTTQHPFGLQANGQVFYPCASGFSSDNQNYGCWMFSALLGDGDIFSRETHDSLRKGTFPLAAYRAKLEQRMTE